MMLDKEDEYLDFTHKPIILKGLIVKGKQLGRTVGLPTANLSFSVEQKLPQFGVYSSDVVIDGIEYKGMTNIGLRPTVDNEERISVETYILDFDQDIYGKECLLRLKTFVRGVKKFNSLQEVKDQVEKDIEVVRKRSKM